MRQPIQLLVASVLVGYLRLEKLCGLLPAPSCSADCGQRLPAAAILSSMQAPAAQGLHRHLQ